MELIYKLELKFSFYNICLHRDGVGEGQVSHVIEHEVNRLKETFRKLSPDYDPKITFVIGNYYCLNIQKNNFCKSQLTLIFSE